MTTSEMSLITLPPEVLYMILDNEVLDKSDWKSLRLVHSDLATNIAPLLFDTISFEFKRNGNQGFNDTYVASAISRLQDLVYKQEYSSVRNIAYFPRRFRFTVKNETVAVPVFGQNGMNRSFSGWLQKTNGMNAFITAFENTYPKLLQVFSNVRNIDVQVSALCLRKHHARAVFGTFCRASHVEGRSLAVTLTALTFGSEAILDCVSNVESLTLRMGRSASGRELDANHVVDIFRRSPRLSAFSISDDAYFREIVEHLPDGCSLPSLRCLEILSSPTKPDSQKNTFYITENDMKKFPYLEELRVDSYAPIPPKSATWFSGVTVWHSLAAVPDIHLRSLNVQQVDIGLLSYLSSPESCSRMEDLSIVFDVCNSLPIVNSLGQVTEEVRYGPQQWKQFGSLLYNAVIPNVSNTIRKLTVTHKDIEPTVTTELDITGKNMKGNCRATDPKLKNALAAVGEYVSFPTTGRRRSHSFPKLETLHLMMVLGQDTEEGTFSDLMASIRNAPLLKDIKLTVAMTDGYNDHKKAGGKAGDFLAEISEYTCWDAKWRYDVGLELEVVDLRTDAKVDPVSSTKHYVFEGKRWHRVSARA